MMTSLFFWISKLIWFFMEPGNTLLMMIAISFALLLKGAYRAAKRLLEVATVLMILIALFPLGDWMLAPLETRFKTNPELPEKLDGIIVLSGGEASVLTGVWDQVELWQAAERSLTFMNATIFHILVIFHPHFLACTFPQPPGRIELRRNPTPATA